MVIMIPAMASAFKMPTMVSASPIAPAISFCAKNTPGRDEQRNDG